MGFLRRLIRPPVLLTTGGVMLGATGLALTRIFGLSLLIAVLLVVTIVLVSVILILMRQLKTARGAEEIERTITRQADRDIDRSLPGQTAEMEGMKSELLTAIEALKSSKLGRWGQRGALSSLPWYLVIGPAGAGKSTLLAHSGLHFLDADAKRGPRAVRGMGGTRSFDWWIAEEGLFLDMAGRALAPAYDFEDKEDWLSLLGVLRKQRRGSAINGVVVTVGIDQLADSPESEVDALAGRLRDRLEELVHHLGVVFPVYILFTKCDRLAGFSEFAAGLAPEESGQPWGAAFPLDQIRSLGGPALFDTEFGRLVSVLSARRLAQLADIPAPEQRVRAFLFPTQLERLRPAMHRFLDQLFESGPLEEGPLFRGFYFTSAVQEGEAVERILRAEAASLGLAAPKPPPAPAAAGNYFVHDLFARVVPADQDLAAPSGKSVVEGGRRRVVVFAALAVLFLLMAITLFALSRASGVLISNTRQAAVEAARSVRPDVPIMQNLLALEDLRARVVEVDSLTRRKPAWRRLGGYAGDAILDPSLELYTHKALETLLAPAVKEMEGRLIQVTDSGEADFLRYFSLFRAWRLLTEPTQMRAEDASLVGDEMARAMATRLAFASPTDRERFPELLRTQISYLIAHGDRVARLFPDHYRGADPDLVTRGAARLRSTWDSSQFYRQLLVEVEPGLQPADLKSLVGATGLLTGTAQVPGAFTRAGWEKQVKPRLDAYRAQMGRDWVVAHAFDGRPPDVGGDILAAYTREYSEQWVRFLNDVSLSAPRDLPEAAQLLKAAAEADSPLLRLLKAVGEETFLGVDPSSEMGPVSRDFEIVHEFFVTPGAEERTQKLRSIFTRFVQKLRGGKREEEKDNLLDRDQSPSALYQKLLAAAHEKVLASAQPGAPVAVMKTLMAEGDETTNPLKQVVFWVQLLAEGYRGTVAVEPVSRLLLLPASATVVTMQSGLRSEVNTKWGLLVAQPFQRTLAGKYPLVEGGPDAALFDFNEFFRPGGTFWSFYDQELKPYLFEDGTPRAQESGDAPFSADLRDCLRKASEIREALFAADPSAASVRFSVRTTPPRIEGPHVNVRWVSFDVGGAFATYSMGPPIWQVLTWPGQDPTAGAALRANVVGGPPAESREQQGPWGLFRLLDQGQFGQVDRPTPTVTWGLPSGASRLSVVYELQPGSARHPFHPGFLRFRLPDAL